MLQHAFKEWAIICRALAEGRQAVILRKGGVAEVGNVFQPDHSRFWLYPTFAHQQEQGVKPAGETLLRAAGQDKPGQGLVRFTHFVEVPGVYQVGNLDDALALDALHLWTPATVRQRFEYRQPGLYVLPARVWRAAQAFELIETPAYAGCKSWVELEQGLPTEGATPVLDDVAFREVVRQIEAILNPTALA
ncbi:MAG: DUF1802 family protein [Planctomycetia bacterium]|nr:DUF1802 family protein [Planctomycetia bacterium]